MSIKQRLAALVHRGAPAAAPKPAPNFAETTAIREKIKAAMELPLGEFCRKRLDFDAHHGLVYKMLNTSPYHMHNGYLVQRDVRYWLKQKKPVPALWIVRLAGKQLGTVPRNQIMVWLFRQKRRSEGNLVLYFTRKWGIRSTERSKVIAAEAASVADARAQYRQAAGLNPRVRAIFGNKLLQHVASTGKPTEVYNFFKSLNKDVQTAQIMLGAMFKNPGLRPYRDLVWRTITNQSAANNLELDDKLLETYEALRELPAPNKGKAGPDDVILPVESPFKEPVVEYPATGYPLLPPSSMLKSREEKFLRAASTQAPAAQPGRPRGRPPKAAKPDVGSAESDGEKPTRPRGRPPKAQK